MVRKMLSSSMSSFSSETISIGGESVPAVIDVLDLGVALGVGAKTEERSLRVVFSPEDYDEVIRSGETVTARGESWQVGSDPGSIQRGQAAITILLVEPERRSQF